MVCLPVRGTGATSCAIKNVGTDPRISPKMKLSLARSGNEPYISIYKFLLSMTKDTVHGRLKPSAAIFCDEFKM